MEHESSYGGTGRKAAMGIPGNLYITTTCLAFLPLDGSLKTSTVVFMYKNLEHHAKGDFMQFVKSSNSAIVDAVEISDIDGKSIVLTDFLSKLVVFDSFASPPLRRHNPLPSGTK